ncbi:MAG: FxsA family protein [Rhodospirillales bacterium]
MGLILLLAMIGVPILEIVVFIEAGSRLGLWLTLTLVVLTAVIGTVLLRIQGLSTLARARESLAAGEFPIAEVFDGFCLLAGGALLLTPGFVTDALGFLLLLSPVRGVLRRWCRHHLIEGGRLHMHANGRPHREGSGVIDGEFEVVDDDDRQPQGEDRHPDRISDRQGVDPHR